MDDRVSIILFLLLALLYLPLNKRKALYYWKSRLDDKFPLIPIFIVPYLLHIPFLIISFWILSTTSIFKDFLTSQLVCLASGSLFWAIFPNGVKRPRPENRGVSKILNFVYKHDGDTNGFPSGHVFTTTICMWFLHIYSTEAIAVSTIIIGTSIVVSTVFTKQHYVIDVIGGIILALCSVLLVNLVL